MQAPNVIEPFKDLEAPSVAAGRLERWLGADSSRLLRRLTRQAMFRVGALLLIAILLIAVAAPVLAPPTNRRDPYRIPRDGFSAEPRPPGSEWRVRPPPMPAWGSLVFDDQGWNHLLGTTGGQWDIWYGVVWGARSAFRVGLLVTVSTLVIGLVVGAVAGYFGGLVDEALMRLTEIFQAFPYLLAAMVLAALLHSEGRGELPAITALIAFGWMPYARLVRGDVLAVRERGFVLAARSIGAGDLYVLMRHVLPNAIGPALVIAWLSIGDVVLGFAALSFLGIGTEVGRADWGQLLSFARDYISSLDRYWFTLIYPGAALVLFVLGWNLLGDAVRDAMDPRIALRR